MKPDLLSESPGQSGTTKSGLVRRTVPYLFITPATIVLLLIFFYPMVRGVRLSLEAFTPALGISEFAGLENYREILTRGDFWNSLGRSLIWVVCSVAGQFVVGFGFALLLNERWPGNRLVRSLAIIPWVMPGVAVALGWRLIFNGQFGMLNDWLLRVGLPPQQWLSDPSLAMAAVIIANVWKAFPFVTVMMLAGLAAIPRSRYEAATVDGASAFQRFRYVTLPGVRNITFVSVLLMTIWTFNYFDLVYVMTGGGPARATEIAPVLVARYAFVEFDYGLGATVAALMTIINLTFAVFYIKSLRRGIG